MQGVAREVAEHRGAHHQRARQVVDAVDQRGIGARRQVVGGGHPLDGTTGRRSPPSISTLSGVSVKPGRSSRTNSVRWRSAGSGSR